MVQHTATSVVTIERFIIEQERLHPEATGELSGILYDLALAAKMIANKVRSAGLADILGATERRERAGRDPAEARRLRQRDRSSRRWTTAAGCARWRRRKSRTSSRSPSGFKCGKYCLLFDPLDGSSNIDVNVPVGTIFSVVQKITRGARGEMEDMLQPGRRQVAAGYVIYGSSTMLVYTTGQGAHGFTLDPSIGEFLLSHPNIRIPGRRAAISR